MERWDRDKEQEGMNIGYGILWVSLALGTAISLASIPVAIFVVMVIK